MLRVMIVDDELPAREGLRLRLRRERDVAIVGEFADPMRAIDVIRSDRPDVLFLDIHMPILDGFSLVERLGVALPLVVFVTAHERHALRAFGIDALDYVLKPVSQEDMHRAIERARAHLAMAEQSSHAETRELPARSNIDRISFRDDGAIRFVEVVDIIWIEAAGDSVRVHTRSVTHEIRRTLNDILASLPNDRFLRIHRSTIVNTARVRELQPWFHGEYVVILDSGAKLKLSRTYRDALARLAR
jgi:two-component system LytT family response regulator